MFIPWTFIFLLWLLASFIGGSFSTICFSVVFLAALIGFSDEPNWHTAIFFTAIGGAIAGVFLGGAQWLALNLGWQLALKKRFRSGCYWLLANVLSWVLIGAVTSAIGINLALFTTSGELFDGLVWVPFGGAILGVGQWLVLRKYLVKAAWWIGATTLGWSFWWGSAISIFWSQKPIELVLLVFGALIYSIITGIVLVWLLWLTHQRSSRR